ncbi:hypothetical protein [Pantoea sp. 18069]|uniref:hypothetical protein n=1 Tax=Pantoea sp. 18069 TaxID=2681415 RepID=UPI001358FB22|nr:hypothetical protein [Pantoea sp. 18069]
MTATLRHHPPPTDKRRSLQDKPRLPRRWHYGLLALLVACLAVAGAVVPMVWDLLDVFDQLPKMAWFQDLLARSPAVSWSLMLVWGTSVSISLVALLSLRQGWQGVLLVGALTLWAVAWYLHMPHVEQCLALYGTGNICNTWQWVFTISLSLATALYMFVIFLLSLSALGLLFTQPDEATQE